jgi:hypothetical protein
MGGCALGTGLTIKGAKTAEIGIALPPRSPPLTPSGGGPDASDGLTWIERLSLAGDGDRVFHGLSPRRLFALRNDDVHGIF